MIFLSVVLGLLFMFLSFSVINDYFNISNEKKCKRKRKNIKMFCNCSDTYSLIEDYADFGMINIENSRKE